jgi:Ca2+-binding EF-hand superfamily protein
MLSEFQTTKLTYLFVLLDVEKNGVIRDEDFLVLNEKLQEVRDHEDSKKETKNLSLPFIRALLRDLNKSVFDEINHREFLDFFNGLLSSDDDEMLDEYSQLLLGFIFGYFDENKDGFISKEEYEQLFHVFGMVDDESVEAFGILDRNNDERLSRYELANAIETFLTSDDPENPDNFIFGRFDH